MGIAGQKLETGNWKLGYVEWESQVRNQKLETGNWKLGQVEMVAAKWKLGQVELERT